HQEQGLVNPRIRRVSATITDPSFHQKSWKQGPFVHKRRFSRLSAMLSAI
ncbi:hypothetical protein CCACVL1_24337, partial [Corchorus capsularis]